MVEKGGQRTDNFEGPKPNQQGPTADGLKKTEVGTRRKENATIYQRVEILDWYHANGENQSLTARHFDKIYPNLHLKQPIISSWVKNEPKWCTMYELENSVGPSAKCARTTQHPEVTEMLDTWIVMACEDGLLLTGDLICQKWRQFADMRCIPQDAQLTLSEGWLSKYKLWVGLKGVKCHGEAASTCPEAVEKEQH